MKKLLAILLAVSLICCLFAGCGEGTDNTEGTSSVETSSDITSSEETSSDVTSSEEASSTPVSSTPVSSTPASSTQPAQTQTYSRDLLIDDRFSDDGYYNISYVMALAMEKIAKTDTYVIEQNPDEYWKAYNVPEKVVFDTIAQDFVMTDAFKTKLKNNGEEYDISSQGDTCCYGDEGIFMVTIYDYWDCGGFATYEYVKHKDNKNGTATIYYIYSYDAEDQYIEQVITYSGTGGFNIEGMGYSGAKITSTNQALINSVRVKSIKLIPSIPA